MSINTRRTLCLASFVTAGPLAAALLLCIPALSGHAQSAQPAAGLQISAPVKVLRTGVQDPAAAQQRRMQQLRQQVKLPASTHLPSAAQLRAMLPGINGLNGHNKGEFEPGGRYLIEGNGFGQRQGRVTLRPDDRHVFDLKIVTWTPNYVLVEVPADLSGIADAARAELTVASPVERPLSTRAYGFRAARETVPLPGLPPQALSLDKGFLGNDAKVQTNYRLGGRDGTFSVQRATFDPDRSGCHPRAYDRYDNAKVPLAAGFEVVSIEWNHDTLRNRETSDIHETGFDHYEFKWDNGQYATFRSGSQRVYFKKRFNPLGVFNWLVTMGINDAVFKPGHAVCTSRYVATVYASGPRGLAPMP